MTAERTVRISKKAAGYREATNYNVRCHVCRHMVLHGDAPATCRKVTGTIRAADVCDLFEPKPK